MQHDLVLGHSQWHPFAEAADGALEVGVGEWHDHAALVAHEVVMVLDVVAHPLVANHRLACLHALHEPQPLELVENAVDARTADRALGLHSQRVLDLGGGQCTLLSSEQLEQCAPGAAALAPSGGECCLRSLYPLRPGIGLVIDVSAHVTMVERRWEWVCQTLGEHPHVGAGARRPMCAQACMRRH